jgi:hypothetical protein
MKIKKKERTEERFSHQSSRQWIKKNQRIGDKEKSAVCAFFGPWRSGIQNLVFIGRTKCTTVIRTVNTRYYSIDANTIFTEKILVQTTGLAFCNNNQYYYCFIPKYLDWQIKKCGIHVI